MRVFAVIPAYNEERTVGEVVAEVRKYVDEVVVVDDGSSDSTHTEAKKAGARVLRHAANLGLGGALKTGCEYAVKKGASAIVTIDADLQHEPEEIAKLLKALSEGCDIVFGSRNLKSMPMIKKMGNFAIYLASKLIFGSEIKDTQTGFRAFTRDAYEKIKWSSSGYSVASEIAVNASKHKLKYREVEIATIYKDAFKGTTMLDGLRIVFDLILWKVTK